MTKNTSKVQKSSSSTMPSFIKGEIPYFENLFKQPNAFPYFGPLNDESKNKKSHNPQKWPHML